MSSISEESNDGPRVLKGTPFQQHYQILNFHEKRLARVEKRLATGGGGGSAAAANEQQVKMLVQHVQQLSRRVAQVEAVCREAERKAQTAEIMMGQLKSQVDGISVGDGGNIGSSEVGGAPDVTVVAKQKGRKKKGKNVRLEVSEN